MKEFGPGYRRATATQVPLAAIGFVCSMVAWLTGAKFWWAIGGAILILVIPVTLILIFPVNKQLLLPGLDQGAGTSIVNEVEQTSCHPLRPEHNGL